METATDITSRVLADIDSIADAQASAVERAGEDGSFWRTIGLAHRQSIERYGFDSFKRHINFQYGQWGISKYRNRFTLRLLTALLRRGQFPWGAFARADANDAGNIQWPVSIDGETGERRSDFSFSKRRLRAYAAYCGLLWQYSTLNDSLGCMRIAEPGTGQPMPVYLGGRLISQDIAMASLDLNRMASCIPLHDVRRVLEIGAGYGRLAYLFHSLFPKAQYYIVDISPALAVSQNYLAAVFGGDAVAAFSDTPSAHRSLNFLLPYQLEQMSDGFFDLAINVSSFDEMPPDVATNYLRTIGRVCRGHLFLNGYSRASHVGRLGLDELPYGQDWRLLCSKPHEIFPGWVEKVFEIK